MPGRRCTFYRGPVPARLVGTDPYPHVEAGVASVLLQSTGEAGIIHVLRDGRRPRAAIGRHCHPTPQPTPPGPVCRRTARAYPSSPRRSPRSRSRPISPSSPGPIIGTPGAYKTVRSGGHRQRPLTGTQTTFVRRRARTPAATTAGSAWTWGRSEDNHQNPLSSRALRAMEPAHERRQISGQRHPRLSAEMWFGTFT